MAVIPADKAGLVRSVGAIGTLHRYLLPTNAKGDTQFEVAAASLVRAGCEQGQVTAVFALRPYMGESESNKPYTCPAAIGDTSVRTREMANYLQGGGRVYSLPFPGVGLGQEPTTWSEYWFNDSAASQRGNVVSGISGQFVRLVRHPEQVVWATDALDEFPRHSTKKPVGSALNVDGAFFDNLANNFLFGDQSVRTLRRYEYRPEEARDRYGAPGPFYNWGHYYPNGG